MMTKRSGILCLLVIACFAAVVYSQNMTCGDDICTGEPDRTGAPRDECCSEYFSFLTGCCSNTENGNLRLIRDVVIGVSVGVGGLIFILILICVCCCCCFCCG